MRVLFSVVAWGVLVALVAFGAHNMVDTFIQTQLVLP
jgi:hypothetical protein